MIPRTLRSHSERTAEFYVHVQNVLWRRLHSDLSGPLAPVGALKAIVEEERRKFLADNLDFRPDGEVTVKAEGDTLQVMCEVIPWIDLQAREERERLRRETEAIALRARIDQDRRFHRMIKRRNRLSRKYGTPHSLQPGMRSIWDTLDAGQQYAILKDIDYAARHARA